MNESVDDDFMEKAETFTVNVNKIIMPDKKKVDPTKGVNYELSMDGVSCMLEKQDSCKQRCGPFCGTMFYIMQWIKYKTLNQDDQTEWDKILKKIIIGVAHDGSPGQVQSAMNIVKKYNLAGVGVWKLPESSNLTEFMQKSKENFNINWPLCSSSPSISS